MAGSTNLLSRLVIFSVIEIINEKLNICASSLGYRFLESDPVLECCKRKGVRDSCRVDCRVPDSDEWERSGSLQCGFKIMDTIKSCIDGN